MDEVGHTIGELVLESHPPTRPTLCSLQADRVHVTAFKSAADFLIVVRVHDTTDVWKEVFFYIYIVKPDLKKKRRRGGFTLS